jgi:hypothetical protein
MSARAHFDSMLVALNQKDPDACKYTSLEATPNKYFEKYVHIFSFFGSYLMSVARKEFGTTKGYISSIKCHIESRCSDSDILKCGFYRQYRCDVSRKFVGKCIEEDKELSTSSDPMTIEHLGIICKILFQQNSRLSSEHRAIIVVLWQALGRVND